MKTLCMIKKRLEDEDGINEGIPVVEDGTEKAMAWKTLNY